MERTRESGAYVLASREGEALWFLDTLMIVKAAGKDTRGAFALSECELPPGYGPPPHIHHLEDEAFYLLEGHMTVTCGDDVYQAEPGCFVFLPRGIPHAFSVSDDAPARMLQLTSPAQFEHFAAEVGQPAPAPVLPPSSPPDIPRLIAAAERHSIELLLPDSPADDRQHVAERPVESSEPVVGVEPTA